MNINDEAKNIIADNTAANETLPWPGYTVMMKNILVRRTGCTWQEAYYALSDAMMEVAKPSTLTLGDLANRRIDLEISIEKLLSLLVDLNGPYVEKYEVVQKARRVLSQKVGSWQPI
jgi:hypothetical protein